MQKEKFEAKRIELQDLENNVWRLKDIETARDSNEPTSNNFIKHCPASNCKGFLNMKWKYGLCGVQVCELVLLSCPRAIVSHTYSSILHSCSRRHIHIQ